MMSLALSSLETLGRAKFRAPRRKSSRPEKTYYKRSKPYDAPSIYSKQKPPSRLPNLALVSRLSPRRNIRRPFPALERSATILTPQPLGHPINGLLDNLTHVQGFSPWKTLVSAPTSAILLGDRLAYHCVMMTGTRTFAIGSFSSPLLVYLRQSLLLPCQLLFRPLAFLSQQQFKMPFCDENYEKPYWRLVLSRAIWPI